jgi:ATP-binding cassette subfamily C protein LapB
VFQEPWIFGGTLRENIALGFDEIDDVMITNAIKLTGLYSDEMISQEVLDGRIESQGKNLSGGQKQSIALSRALVFEQKTLLLDEPTSAMDQNMEQRLISSLQDYLEDRTLILITHKAAMLRLCNRIVVLENGVIAFDGSKEEYVARVNAK